MRSESPVRLGKGKGKGKGFKTVADSMKATKAIKKSPVKSPRKKVGTRSFVKAAQAKIDQFIKSPEGQKQLKRIKNISQLEKAPIFVPVCVSGGQAKKVVVNKETGAKKTLCPTDAGKKYREYKVTKTKDGKTKAMTKRESIIEKGSERTALQVARKLVAMSKTAFLAALPASKQNLANYVEQQTWSDYEAKKRMAKHFATVLTKVELNAMYKKLNAKKPTKKPVKKASPASPATKKARSI